MTEYDDPNQLTLPWLDEHHKQLEQAKHRILENDVINIAHTLLGRLQRYVPSRMSEDEISLFAAYGNARAALEAHRIGLITSK